MTIPNSVTTIGDLAFHACSGLTSVTIPNSVTSLGERPFSNCSGLASIVIEEGNSKYDSRNNCNAIIETATNILLFGIKNTIIPDDVISIGPKAFNGCKGLTSLTIPNSVTSIGVQAFNSCSDLTSVIIPNSVTTIGQYAFVYCSSLTSVKCFAEDVPSTNVYAFLYSNSQNATLYVPAGSIDAYKTTAPWSGFGTILSLDEVTGIELPYSDHLSIQSDGGMLIIEGADAGTPCYVYTIDGRMVKEGITTSSPLTLDLPEGCIYILKVGTKTMKVAL